MNAKTKTRNIPLYLYQVLEEEYESLHGVINPEGVDAYLPNPNNKMNSQKVVSKRGWNFEEGHIKDSASFIRMLRGNSDGTPGAASPYGNVKPDLLTYLRIRLLEDLTTSVGDSGVEGSTATDHKLAVELKKKLNEKVLTDATLYRPDPIELKDGTLYRPDRFSYRRLSNETRGLLSLREAGVEFDRDDIKHFNRLLLEDAFPRVFYKISDIRLAALNTLLHGKEQSALCLSGGGIRSGTFALGLMQGLARHDLLGKFDYLSTVSGGGYIGSWLTSWIHRHPERLAGVTRDLAHGEGKKVDPDPAPLSYLRRYSNFITPKVGLLTADTWTFIGIYLRNTLLNSMVFIPLLLAVLMIPRVLLALTLMQEEADQLTEIFQFPWVDFMHWRSGWQVVWLKFFGRHVFLTLGILLGSWSLAYIIFNRPGLRSKLEERRPWFRGKTGQGGFLWMCLLPLVSSAYCLTTYFAWAREVKEGENVELWKFCLFGLGFALLGWLIAAIILKRFGKRGETNLFLLGGLLLVGMLGGTIIYVLAQTRLDSPVIGYDKPFNWLTYDWLNWRTEVYLCIAVPLFLLVFLLTIVLFIGLTSASRIKFVEDEDREWWARLGAWVLISIIVWSVANVLVIFGPIALLELPKLLAALGGLSGLITLLAGRSMITPAAEGEQAQAGIVSRLMGGLLPLLALFFLALLIAALSLATSGLFQGIALIAPWVQTKLSWPSFGWWVTNARSYEQHIGFIYSGIPANSEHARQLIHMNVLHHTWTWCVLGVGVVLAVFGLVLSLIINLNLFSLHGGYRNRLIRAFLGASRPDHARKPNPFTGFDPTDDLHMHELLPTLLDESDLVKPGELARQLKAAMKFAKSPPPPQEQIAATTAGGGALQEPNSGANQESEQPNAVSLHLVREEKDNPRREERLKNARVVLQDYAPDAPVSERLIADLRADLNTILKVDCLYGEDFAQPLLLTGRGHEFANAIKRSQGIDESADISTIDRAKLRTDYHILLNRLVLEAAYPGVFKASTLPPYKLMHVINTTLNLVGGDNLAWQQRKAEPFSISPLHAGCFRVGYRNSRDYGGRNTNGISIGTAATASGAAASSNMGYYTTSPAISLLLTLFNVRLGLWLGNPGPHGNDTYHLGSPRLSFKPVVSEAFGLTDDTNGYVYLTDGGHFENLALYEMVLRRCHFIVVSDGAQDGDFRFGDLGNAVRKIRIDFGVPIEFTDMPIYPKRPPADEGGGTYWAIARIRYSCVDTVWDEEKKKAVPAPDGMLLYIKPTIYGDEPRDVLEYKESFPTFPHQSTGDQFFDEPQFESYRMLGSHVMDKICGAGNDELDLREMFTEAFNGLDAAKPQELKRLGLNSEFVQWMKEMILQWTPVEETKKPTQSDQSELLSPPEILAPPEQVGSDE